MIGRLAGTNRRSTASYLVRAPRARFFMFILLGLEAKGLLDFQGLPGHISSTAKLRIWTLRIWGFRGPGFRSARQVLCGDASHLFLDHFS